MSLEFVTGALRELVGLGVERVEFCGRGEPTLNPHIGDIMRSAGTLGIKGTLITNGSGFSPELVKAIRESELDSLCISLYAASEERFRQITRSTTEATPAGILKWAETCLSTCPKTKLKLLWLVQPSTLGEMDKMVELSSGFPNECCSFIPALPYNDAHQVDSEYDPEWARFHSQLSALSADVIEPERLSFAINSLLSNRKDPVFRPKGARHPCYAGSCIMFICDDYTIRPCSNSRRILGDLGQNSVEEIWNGKKYEQFRLEAESTNCNAGQIAECYCTHCGWGLFNNAIHNALSASSGTEVHHLLSKYM